MKTPLSFVFIVLSFIFVGLSPEARPVSPPPDGGYAGGNTAEGEGALLSLSSGTYNTAVGLFSLLSTSTDSFNTAVGAGTLLSNAGGSLTSPDGVPSGSENTAVGAGALLNNTIGAQNTGNGAFALFSNTEANFNTGIGARALFLNTIGTENTAVGSAAMENNLTGNFNSAHGSFALFFNDTGNDNTAIGDSSLFSNTAGNNNVAIGTSALFGNFAGNNNVAVGISALHTATGSGCIALGFEAGSSIGSSGNVIAIGSPGDDVDNSCFIGNIRDVQTQNADAIPVLVDSAGQLGTASSSARFKKEIQPMDRASEAILALKPVSFHYKNDRTNTPQFGLIAEEVAKVNPNLVVRDKTGEIYTVRYEAVNAMLLNEFLKQHRKVEAQIAEIGNQRSKIAALESTVSQLQTALKTQGAQIQKVIAQVEAAQNQQRVVCAKE